MAKSDLLKMKRPLIQQVFTDHYSPASMVKTTAIFHWRSVLQKHVPPGPVFIFFSPR